LPIAFCQLPACGIVNCQPIMFADCHQSNVYYLISNIYHLPIIPKISILLVLLLGWENAYTQHRETTTVPAPVQVSIDKSGNFYLCDAPGNILQYNWQGQLLQTISSQRNGTISSIEAWNPLRIFIFYREHQEYILLDRFLTPSQPFMLPAPEGEWAAAASQAYDNNLWIFDISSFSLKKYDLNFRQFTLVSPLNLVLDSRKHEVFHVREYQSLVFVGDTYKGVLVFDNMGTYLRTLGEPGIRQFNFLGDWLYYLHGSHLVMEQMYTREQRKITVEGSWDFVLMREQGAYLFSSTGQMRYLPFP
jgi:hypothetical protein